MPRKRLPRPLDEARNLDLTSAGNRNRDAQSGNRESRRASSRHASSRRKKAKTSAGKGGALWRFSVSNALFLAILWIVERFNAEGFAPTTFITYIPQHGFGIASLCLVLWAMWRREKKAFSLNAAALAFFVFTFLGFNVPWRALAPRMSTHVAAASAAAASGDSSQTSLRVMTYNILRGQRGIEGLVAVIKAARPDVLCLQESDAWGGLGPLPSAEIARRLPGWHSARQGELAVISRFPIVSSRDHPPRGATRVQEVVLKIAGHPVSVFNTHFNVRIGADIARRSISMKPEAARKRELQLGQLLHALDSARAPFVVAGDFNTPPRGLVYHALAARLDNAWRQAGWGAGYSFPARLPLLRIDHIWMSRHVRATRCFVPSSRASDHCPVVADLQIDFATK